MLTSGNLEVSGSNVSNNQDLHLGYDVGSLFGLG